MSISIRPLAMLMVAASLPGCATVSSQHVEAGQNAQAGIAYFLPRQLARVTVTRTDGSLDDKIKAVIDAQAKLEDAEAKVAETTAAIRATEDSIIAAAGGDSARAILAARLATLQAALAAATADVPKKQTALDAAKEDLRAAVREASNGAAPRAAAAPAARPGQNGNRARRDRNANRAPDPNADPARRAPGQPPAQQTGAQARGPGSYKVTLKIELLTPSADPVQAYRLSPHHSITRDDEHRLVVSPAGLLTSTDVVAVDRTADILVEIGTFIGAMATGAPPGFTDNGEAPTPPKPARCDAVPASFSGVVDFADANAVEALNLDLECLGVRTRVSQAPWPQSTRPVETAGRGVDGIVYRTPVEVQVRIERCTRTTGYCPADDDKWFATEVIALSLPQAGPISYVRQDAGFMTRSHYGLAFKDGILTSYDASRPSELLEVARTPMRIVDGVFSGASRILSLRTGQNNARAALSASELAVQNANFALRTGQITGQTGITNAQLAALNAEYALRAAQITGETSVVNAQLAALNAEFALRAAQINGQAGLSQAELAALNAQFALQSGQITGQTGLTNAQLGLLQSQGALATGGNTLATQLSASELARRLSLLRDQARTEALTRCIAQRTGLGESIDSCLINP